MKNVLLTFSAFMFLAAGIQGQEAAPVTITIPVPADALVLPTPSPTSVPMTRWKKDGRVLANFSQVYFDNWTSGGEDMLSWKAGLNVTAIHDSPHDLWTSTLKLAYGESQIAGEDPRKMADSIRGESVYIRRIFKVINPFLGGVFESQFVRGYSYQGSLRFAVSNFMDPGYFTESAGIAASYKDVFSTRLGAAAKQTLTHEFPVPYADDPRTPNTERVRRELGGTWVTDIKIQLGKNILYATKMDLFSVRKIVNQVDARWTQVLTATINPWFNTNLTVDIDYDRDTSIRRQLRGLLSLGLLFDFM